MAASRLRKAFKYPEDDASSDQAPNEGIDEEEQDKMIKDLKQSDTETTSLYRFILSSAIYLIAVVYLGLGVLFGDSFNAVGSLTMGASAFFIDRQRWTHPLLTQQSVLASKLNVATPYRLDLGDEIVILVNTITIGALLIANAEGLGWAAPWPPMIMFSVALLARWLLEPVDVAELERLKYSYKGA